MKKKTYTKEHIAQKLGIQTYIMSGWEKQFEIEPEINNGEKIYTRKHLAQLRTIKELLYEKGFSLDAAKNYVKHQKTLEGSTLIAAAPLNFDKQQQVSSSSPADLLLQPTKVPLSEQGTQIQQVRKQLLAVKEQLLKISNSL